MRLAEQYLDAFGNIAKKGNTIVLPSNAGDASSMVAQATAIYQNLTAAAPSEADGEGKVMARTNQILLDSSLNRSQMSFGN